MKKLNLLLGALLSFTIIFGAAVTANAASTEVYIEIKETAMDNVSVTVPSTLPIIFNEDGTNTLPTNWSIENKSPIAGIHLSKIDMDAGESNWKLLADSQDTKSLAADTKSIRFSVGKGASLKTVVPTNGTEDSKGSVTFGASEIAIASGEKQILSFGVKRGAFTTSQASAKAFDMILTFDFN